MSVVSNNAAPASIDQIFSLHAVRADRWRDLLALAKRWQAGHVDTKQVQAYFSDIAEIELLHAYPGPGLLASLAEHLHAERQDAFAALAGRISFSILTRYYKSDAQEWHADSPGTDVYSRADLHDDGGIGKGRPYFELLIVAPANSPRVEHQVRLLKAQRRKEDSFVYEPVVVNTFQDAFCAIASNTDICAVAIFEGIEFKSKHQVPLLDRVMGYLNIDVDEDHLALQLATSLKEFRPEVDIYLLSDRHPEDIASDKRAASVRRVLYAVEEPVELHLSVLEGIAQKYDTPFFDNLKNYARRPISTFHALPIARGKSVFKSDWIRDMGEFYGQNLFLAESSATTGGLDSLLEPVGNIKKAQEQAARAFGADHCFFVTNGTSTSNKIVLMGIAAPGEIIIVDRNCHKSHHYGMALGDLRPYYVEAFPMKAYSMYGAVPLRSIKSALLSLKRQGKLHLVRAVDLTNCTFDGHVYNTRRVMEECLAIKPDLVFLWDEAWFGFARWSPFLRPRTAMGAAAAIEQWLQSPSAAEEFEAQQTQLGDNPDLDTLLDARLIPDPTKVRLRVYQTNSTHKSMSAFRQGSMILVKDVDFYAIEPQLHEAIFTHSTTSPNQQLIASLDVARRQMELEGYGLVKNAIQIALDIRHQIASHPLVSKYFHVLGADEMIPDAFRSSGFKDFLEPGTNWDDAARSVRDDEFFLDPTRITLVCGTAGFDGTEFKNILADQFDIQLNKTSRNSVLLQSNINNTRSDVAHLIRVLAEIASHVETKLKQAGDAGRQHFEERVKSLMEDVPELPNFSFFEPTFRHDTNGEAAVEGDIRSAFFLSWNPDNCEYVGLNSAECDKRLAEGPAMVSAKMVIPYPPGFPILVPGQVIQKDIIEFMRKLDVKEVHGYEAHRGLQLIRMKPSSVKP